MRSFRSLAACAAVLASLAVGLAPAAPAFATDLSVTAANVVAASAARTERGVAGETITAGQQVYYATATRKWMKADSNAAGAEARGSGGVATALNGAALNQPLVVARGGPITIGATLTPGVAYYLSDTAGGICPYADVGSGEYVVLLGLATSSTVLDYQPRYTGVAN